MLAAVTARQSPASAVIVAPAGVGKSRLLRETLAQARAQGLRAHLAIATRSARASPYGALAHLVPDSSVREYDDPASWYRAFAQALAGGGERPVLGVDDAHLLDPGSADLILHLALTGAATVFVAVRRGESVPEPITTLWKDSLADRVDLQPLSHAEMCEAITAGLDRSVSGRTCDRLARVSSGNVLFAREVVRAAIDAGSLTRHDGVWRWDEQIVLAPRLRDTVRHRLGDLADPAQEALALVALGEPMPARVLAPLVDATVVADLERAGLLAIADHGTCRVAHPLYGEVVLAELGRLRTVQLSRRLIDVLDAPGASPDDVVRLATWRLDLDEPVEPTSLAEAAVLANRAFDHALAERLARAAYDRGRLPLAAVALAHACNGQDRYREAEAVLDDAEASILASTDPSLHQRYLDRRHTALYMGLDEHAATEAMIDRFLVAHAHAGPAHRAQATALAGGHRAQITIDEGRLGDVVELGRATLDDPAAAGSVATLLALETTAEAHAYAGRLGLARELHERLHALFAIGEPEVRRALSSAVLQECLCRTLEGRLDDALELAEQIRAQTVTDPDGRIRALVALALGSIQLQRGTCHTARRTLLDALDGFAGVDSGGAASWAAALLTQATALCGDHEAAATALRRSHELRLARPRARMQVDFALAEASVRMAGGDVTGAVRAASVEPEGWHELAVPQARLLHRAVNLGAPAGPARDRLVALHEHTDLPLLDTLVDHAAALSAGDAPGLMEAADAFADTGMLLSAAEAYAQATVAWYAAGRTSDADRARARAMRLVAECEGARTPALAALGDMGGGTPVSLSRREHEVAALAASGLGNAEIAERLVLSVRTVESHLYRAYAKLGVERREELAGALAR